MKEITTIVCRLEQDANTEYHAVEAGACTTGQGLVYDHMTGYRCLKENGTLGHCVRVTSDGYICPKFNLSDAFKVGILANDLNQLKTNTIKNADKKKAFIWNEIKP
jgi:hypothetical protein